MTEPIFLLSVEQALQMTLRQLASMEKKLARIDRILGQLIVQGEETMMELETLTAQVSANTDAESSAILLLNQLAGMIASIKTDPAALQALADKLRASASALGEAIVANTPSA